MNSGDAATLGREACEIRPSRWGEADSKNGDDVG